MLASLADPALGVPVEGAELAAALRKATERSAKAVRERRVPEWEAVRETVAYWDSEESGSHAVTAEGATEAIPAPVTDPVVREGAGLLLEALEEFSRSLDAPVTSDPPATSDPPVTSDQPVNPDRPVNPQAPAP
nr:hypothetical protein [Streptomyces finlayi]